MRSINGLQHLLRAGKPATEAAIRGVMPPPIRRGIRRLLGSGRETASARYCYAVWMRHLTRAEAVGVSTEHAAIAELGPGASLGVGLAALLSGAGSYEALDVVRHAAAADSQSVFEELVHLYADRASIPGQDEFPEVRPELYELQFPDGVLDDARLISSLAANRVAELRASVARSEIRYVVPWDDPMVVQQSSLDFVFSQAVMEHVADLELTYRSIHRWLRPGGLMQHQIDLRSHGTHSAWNGHWTYGNRLWWIVRGDASINRQPASAHLEAIKTAGFEVTTWEPEYRTDGLSRAELAEPWRQLSDKDATAAGVFLQAFKG